MRTLPIYLLALLPTLALADTALPRSGDLVETLSTGLPLRESTPDSLLGDSAQIGWLKKGDSVRVLESRQYVSMFGTEIWVQVQKVDEPSVHGWIYDGIGKDIVHGKGKLQITQAAPAEVSAAPASTPGAVQPEDPADQKDAAAAAARKESDRLLKDLLLQ